MALLHFKHLLTEVLTAKERNRDLYSQTKTLPVAAWRTKIAASIWEDLVWLSIFGEAMTRTPRLDRQEQHTEVTSLMFRKFNATTQST